MRKGNIRILGIPERKEREQEAESLFKETIAVNFPNWGNNWIHKTMKLRQCLITSMEKTFSKIHYIETVKSQ